MKAITFKRIILSVTALFMFCPVFAQEKKFEIAPSADLVSSYVWRGIYQTGASVQPSLTASFAGLYLSAWGSTDFSISSDAYRSKEVDLILGYEIGGFNVFITDYWWSGEGAHYGRYSTDHYYEATVSYNFGEKFPLSLSWGTMFAGGDKKENGKQYFSSYFEAAYDFNVWGIDFTPSIGISPWKGMYSSTFGVNSVSFKASKTLNVTESFSFPIFTQFIVDPEHDDIFLVFGLSF